MMRTLKATAIASLFVLSLAATSVFAEAPAAPSTINPNDHAALASYYNGLAKEVSAKLEAYQHELQEYEDHPYAYGRQGQDLNSHLRANIREYSKELAEDLEQVELHKKMSSMDRLEQFNKAKAKIDVSESVVQ